MNSFEPGGFFQQFDDMCPVDTSFAGEHVFYIDGFPDFTRQHMDIIALLIRMSPSVTVCLNCDAVDSTNMAFEKAGQTARQLVDAAKKANIPVEIRRLSEEEGALQEIRSLVFQGNIVSKPEMAEKLELKNGRIMWPVRTALSGKAVTPGGAVELCHILGKDETLRRLRLGLEKLKA